MQVDKADIALIVSEFEVDKARAERVLREQGGDVEKSLHFLIQS